MTFTGFQAEPGVVGPTVLVAAALLAGLGHRLAVAGCVCANLDPQVLAEPEDARTCRFAGLAPLDVVERQRFEEIVEHLRPAGGRGR